MWRAVAGVTKMTVFVRAQWHGPGVGGDAAEKVLGNRAATGLSAQPARAKFVERARAHNTIGLFNLWFDFGVGTQKIQFIQSALNQRGFDVPIFGIGLHDAYNEEVQAQAIASIRRQKPRGLVCFTRSLHPRALQELRRYQDEGWRLGGL